MPTVTINGVDYDVYADLPTAQAYLAAQITATAWNAADPTTQSQALVSMTRTLDRQLWQGAQTDGYETHAWPRTGLYYPDGTPVDPESVPLALVDACCEGAAQLVDGSTLQDVANTFNYDKVIKAGSVSVEKFRQVDDAPRFPQVVQELIGFWLGGDSSNIPVGARSTGTGGRSIMGEKYDVNRGF
jgi:hypothetical protein